MAKLEKFLRKYDYRFPEHLIANKPAQPRDSARLLIYDRRTKKTSFDTFKNIHSYLPAGSVLVFNETRVIPARLTLVKASGGKVQALYLRHSARGIEALTNRPLTAGSKLTLNGKIFFTVKRKLAKGYLLQPSFPPEQIIGILNKYGVTPLPPYIKKVPLTESQIKKQYQSVFARKGVSVAAPTASLHFTKQLIAKLKKQGIPAVFVTLNVNLGTFAPLTEQHLKSKSLHAEYYSINKTAARTINEAKTQKRPIIAVGTTVVRTLESAANKGKITCRSGQTTLFISPGYKFQIIDGLITNFHVPKSSLLMLVSAFAGRTQVLKIYRQAMAKQFRLFSFGDGMLIS